MTPDAIRAGLKVAMKAQRGLSKADRESMSALISAGLLVLRAVDEASRPVPETVPGDFRPTAYAPMATRRLAL